MFMSMSVYSDTRMCTAPMFRSQDRSSVCSALPILPWMLVLSAWSYSSCWRLQRQEPCADDSSSVSEMHRETLSSLQMSAEVAWPQEAAHACSTAGLVNSLPKQDLRVFWSKLVRTGMMVQPLTCTRYFTQSPPSYVV